ncbi:hypothetical protein N7488_009977 [Penicillium malachiteum]|nr:hypothetical protein N7488_009977 [Penicillium malachiteum]
MDGTYIASAVLGVAPTSRGSIAISSADPTAAPLIDPNYYATEFDRATLRAGIRQVTKLLRDTPEGQEMILEELAGPGMPALSSTSSDEELDKVIKACGATFYHPAGSAAMGKVVDTQLRVNGVEDTYVVGLIIWK